MQGVPAAAHFDGPAACRYAEFLHLGYLERVGDDPYVAEPAEIGERAYRYAKAFHALRRFSNQANEEAVFAAYAGVFVYAYEKYGADFIEVSRWTCPSVAKYLRAVSADSREDYGRRYQLLCSQLTTAPPLTLTIRAAERQAVAKQLLITATAGWVRKNQVELRAWVDTTQRLMDAMNRLYGRKRFAKVANELKSDNNQLHARIGMLRRRVPRTSAVVPAAPLGNDELLVPAAPELPEIPAIQETQEVAALATPTLMLVSAEDTVPMVRTRIALPSQCLIASM